METDSIPEMPHASCEKKGPINKILNKRNVENEVMYHKTVEIR